MKGALATGLNNRLDGFTPIARHLLRTYEFEIMDTIINMKKKLLRNTGVQKTWTYSGGGVWVGFVISVSAHSNLNILFVKRSCMFCFGLRSHYVVQASLDCRTQVILLLLHLNCWDHRHTVVPV